MKLEIGSKLVVFRDSEDPARDGRLPVILAHGRAFGSGEHETTRSCLEELEAVSLSPGSKVLDLGCGTGILSVAAARMGARRVIALDPCPNAIVAAMASIRLNGMETVIFPVQGDLSAIRGVHFDLILANLYSDIILRSAGAIASLLAPDGTLVASGLQYEDVYDARIGFTRAGCSVLKTRYLEDYCTIVLGKIRNGPSTQRRPESSAEGKPGD
jgi:ribosomal protein L11 methyltransferase